MKTFYQFLSEASSQYSGMHNVLRRHGFEHEKTENSSQGHKYTWTKLGHSVIITRGLNQPHASWKHYDHAKVQHPLLNTSGAQGHGITSLSQHLNSIK